MNDRRKTGTDHHDSEETEGERQQEVSVWARAFGVSSDALGGALDDGRPHARGRDVEPDAADAGDRNEAGRGND